ncbi:unnamed protein product [Mytilus edulis]|uniref:Uncharacterized protein n=1 Tax=Mytilus edulis TaxID=6550 RepID=A0A8S3PYP6_MYTED|nr:unnamed protein product [Mytilus edulis]
MDHLLMILINAIFLSVVTANMDMGQQMKCLPSLRQCRLRDIDRKTAVDAGQTTEAFIHSWNKGDKTINNANEKVVVEMYFADFNEIIDNISLRGALQEFHEDFKYPVYKEKKIPDDSEVLNITRSAGKT